MGVVLLLQSKQYFMRRWRERGANDAMSDAKRCLMIQKWRIFLLPRAFIIALEVGSSLFHFSKIVASQSEKPVKILAYLKAALTLTPSR